MAMQTVLRGDKAVKHYFLSNNHLDEDVTHPISHQNMQNGAIQICLRAQVVISQHSV